MLLSDLYLWLSYSHVTTRKINKLLERYTPEQLWNSFDEEGKYDPADKTFSLLKRTRSVEYIERAKQYLKLNHIEYVTRADPVFPEGLLQREVDPPTVLYYKGNLDIAREPCIAAVGTRRSSQYGKFATEKIVSELAKRFTIVSGLATGIDGFAHAAALEAGGNTIAVLGSGLFNVTPVSHAKLFDDICKRGLVISEYTPETHATEYTFPQRNRIISGLSKGVLVVEASDRSGSLITANCALEQGRDVFAVPGDIDRQRSIGANKLIKNGATPVTCADDIFDFYGVSGRSDEKKSVELDFTQQKIVELLEDGEKSFDALIEQSGFSVADVNTALSELLLSGLVHERSKNVYCVA